MDSELTALKRSYFWERFRARNSQATQLLLTLALVYVVYTAIGWETYIMYIKHQRILGSQVQYYTSLWSLYAIIIDNATCFAVSIAIMFS